MGQAPVRRRVDFPRIHQEKMILRFLITLCLVLISSCYFGCILAMCALDIENEERKDRNPPDNKIIF